MCCESTHGARIDGSDGDSVSRSERDRCQCTGSLTGDYVDGLDCRCCLAITGEDLRCNRCRRLCPPQAVVAAVRLAGRPR